MDANAVIILILAVAIGGACVRLYKEKKRGSRCIGCATGDCCHAGNGSHASCRHREGAEL